MKLTTGWKSVILISIISFSGAVLAATPDEETDKKCKKPKFREFTPIQNTEVLPESQFSFHISRDADPLHITAEVKGEKVPVTVVNKIAFIMATAKLPASLREGFVRIHVTAKAAEGECVGGDGWLIRIKGPESTAGQAAK